MPTCVMHMINVSEGVGSLGGIACVRELRFRLKVLSFIPTGVMCARGFFVPSRFADQLPVTELVVRPSFELLSALIGGKMNSNPTQQKKCFAHCPKVTRARTILLAKKRYLFKLTLRVE